MFVCLESAEFVLGKRQLEWAKPSDRRGTDVPDHETGSAGYSDLEWPPWAPAAGLSRPPRDSMPAWGWFGRPSQPRTPAG